LGKHMTKKSDDDTAKVEHIHVDKIILNRRFQVRAKIDPKTVNEYATAMKIGEEFPPVRLARIKGALVLLDGWHRISARVALAARSKDRRAELEWLLIPATIENMTDSDARWVGATANLKNGLRLKRHERENIFRLFVRSRRYIKPSGQMMSSREMAAAIHGVYSHTAILQKIKRHYPRVYEKMRNGEDMPTHLNGHNAKHYEMPSLMPDDALGLLAEARSVAHAVTDREQRQAIYAEARRFVEELERDWQPEPEEF